jgi:hypothetical protein
MAWTSRSALKNVLMPPIQPQPVPTSGRTRDECGGFVREPLINAYCQQITRKDPQSTCLQMFSTRPSQNKVCKTYCINHRYCYFPLSDGSRCDQFRRNVDSLYCTRHESQEVDCQRRIANYKAICGKNPLQSPCHIDDGFLKLQSKIKKLRNCHDARYKHEQSCVHSSAVSPGHSFYVRSLIRERNRCQQLAQQLQNQTGGSLSFDPIDYEDDGSIDEYDEYTDEYFDDKW